MSTTEAFWTKRRCDYDDGTHDYEYTTTDGFTVSRITSGWLVFGPGIRTSSEVRNLARAREVIEYVRENGSDGR